MTSKVQHSRIKVMFVLAAFFLAALSVLSYIRIKDLIDSTDLVNHTQLIKLDLEEIRSAIIDAETNQKSYLLTGDSSVLSRRDTAVNRLTGILKSVDSLTRDNPIQIENLKILNARIGLKLSSMKKVMSLQASPVRSPEFVLNVTEGIQLTQDIKKQITTMKDEEDKLLKIRSSSLNKSAFITPLLTVSLIIGSILILTTSYFRIMRELKKADNLSSNIEQGQHELVLINETLKNKTSQLVEGQQLAHIGSWEWNVVANKIEWSDELYRIYGLAPQEFEATYENFLKYIHPDDRDFVNGIVQGAFQTQEPFSFVHRVVTPDGTVKVISSTGRVSTDGNGKTVRMAGTAQDVTSQKKYEEGLKESEERFLKIFDYNPVPMTLAEIKTNKISYANRAFYTTFGYSDLEVIGHTSEELNLIGPEENQRLVGLIFGYLQETRTVAELQALSVEETEELLAKLKETDAMKNLEILYTRKNGETFPAVVSFEIIRFGEQRYTISSYQDITDRRNAQDLLTRQNASLAKANKELESFNFISSHDLQEPLRQIQNFSSRLITNEQQNLTDKGKTYLVKMNDAADRMRTLITDLLTYSRTTNTERKFEMTNLNEIVKEVLEELKETIDEKHATIEAGDLHDARVIPFQFRQMMHNLIGNALKFSKPGSPPVIVIRNRKVNQSEANNAGLSPGKEYSHISVADNGLGFDPQYKDRIFDVFQRVHDKEKFAGTGIGLSIVKKIVDNHNGIVTATSEPDKGATFDIYIPSS
ncbi:MAG TPA: PAS domain S-box protein [Cyclobacteriaceae bacterium]|nr:PAS domain S-box protein [Cyclobacteriaceae bacterium]